MTRKQLSQLYYLNKEIEQETKRLHELQQMDNIAGLPHIRCAEDLTINEQIKECQVIIERKKRAAVAEYKEIIKYIETIDSSLMRQIITFRYIHKYSWVKVAMCIGGGNTPDSVRRLHDRFLNKY